MENSQIGSEAVASFGKKGRSFGDISVHRETGQILFPAQQFSNVVEAEGFMCKLIDAITFARKVTGDPL